METIISRIQIEFENKIKTKKTWSSKMIIDEYNKIANSHITNIVEDINKVRKQPRRTGVPKKVYAYNATTGKFIQGFNSIREAAKAIDRVPMSITNVIKGRAITCGGYIWKTYKTPRVTPVDDSTYDMNMNKV